VYGHGLVYFCTGYFKHEVCAVRPDGRGAVTRDHVAWRQARHGPASASPLLIDDILYTVSDPGILTARAALTGRELWSQRLGASVCASPIYAAGGIYVCHEDGKTSVVRPGAHFELLARNQLDGRMQASPAIAGRALYLRTDTHLYRIEDAGD
jgi:outer membrane protein assembly factor BamB